MTTYVRDGLLRSTQVTEDVLVRDISDKISNITEVTKRAPFWLFLEKYKKAKRNVTNMKYEILESDILDRKATIVTGTTISSGTTLAVSEKGIFVQNMTIFNATVKEYARVTTAVSGVGAGNLAVTLMTGTAIGHATGTATGVWGTGDILLALGVTSTEGATDPQCITRQLDTRFNYCEIVDTEITITDIAKMSKQFGGDRVKYETRMAMIEHMASLEMKLLFGMRSTSTDTNTYWTTGGLIDSAVGISSDNIIDCTGGAFTKNTFENDFLYQIYKNGGSSKKIAFCSPGGLVLLNKLFSPDANVQVKPGNEMIGQSTRTIFHALGQLELVPHYLLNPDRYGAAYGNMIFVVDPDHVGLVGFAGQGGVMVRKDREENNVNRDKTNIRTIFGVELDRPTVHGMIHNFAI